MKVYVKTGIITKLLKDVNVGLLRFSFATYEKPLTRWNAPDPSFQPIIGTPPYAPPRYFL